MLKIPFRQNFKSLYPEIFTFKPLILPIFNRKPNARLQFFTFFPKELLTDLKQLILPIFLASFKDF